VANSIDRLLVRLRAAYPGWEIWWVPCYPSPDKWNARRRDSTGTQISVGSSAELVERLKQADEAGRMSRVPAAQLDRPK
jgi:hypothetical protein